MEEERITLSWFFMNSPVANRQNGGEMKEKRETTTAAGQQTAEKVGSSQQNERPFPGFTGFTEFRTRSFLNSSHSTVLFGAISFLFYFQRVLLGFYRV